MGRVLKFFSIGNTGFKAIKRTPFLSAFLGRIQNLGQTSSTSWHNFTLWHCDLWLVTKSLESKMVRFVWTIRPNAHKPKFTGQSRTHLSKCNLEMTATSTLSQFLNWLRHANRSVKRSLDCTPNWLRFTFRICKFSNLISETNRVIGVDSIYQKFETWPKAA